jgi:hypothetical protein
MVLPIIEDVLHQIPQEGTTALARGKLVASDDALKFLGDQLARR